MYYVCSFCVCLCVGVWVVGLEYVDWFRVGCARVFAFVFLAKMCVCVCVCVCRCVLQCVCAHADVCAGGVRVMTLSSPISVSAPAPAGRRSRDRCSRNRLGRRGGDVYARYVPRRSLLPQLAAACANTR